MDSGGTQTMTEKNGKVKGKYRILGIDFSTDLCADVGECFYGSKKSLNLGTL